MHSIVSQIFIKLTSSPISNFLEISTDLLSLFVNDASVSFRNSPIVFPSSSGSQNFYKIDSNFIWNFSKISQNFIVLSIFFQNVFKISSKFTRKFR